MKCRVAAVLALIPGMALAQSPMGVPVPSPNRLSGPQAAASLKGSGGQAFISAGNTHDPLQIVDSTGKVMGRYERITTGGTGGATVIFLLDRKTTRLWNLSLDCPTVQFICPAGQPIRSTSFVFAAAEGAVTYTSSDCSGTPRVINFFPGAEQSAVAVKEADGTFNLYVADVSGPVGFSPSGSWFANGQCNAGAPPPTFSPPVGAYPHAYPVTMVLPASEFGTPPFHIE